MEWYPWYPIDFRRKTLHLSFAEDGAYRRLIDEYMVLRGPLPDDDAALARLLGVSMTEWLTVAVAVRRYFRAKDGLLIHMRCETEIDAQNIRNKRFSDRGKKAAFAKYSRTSTLTPRRMLVPTTLQDITFKTSGSEQEPAREPQAVKSVENLQAATDEIAAIKAKPADQRTLREINILLYGARYG